MYSPTPIWRRIADGLGISHIVQKLDAILRQHKHLKLKLLQYEFKAKERTGGGQGVDKGTQLLLSLKYQELAKQGVVLPFSAVEFRNFSQTGEDGILHYIYSLIGTTNKRSVEMCAGIGSECSTANLILNHGWHALLVEGDEGKVRRGQKFFADHPDSTVMGPIFQHRWISRENVNEIVGEAGFSGEIDLLSIDMDGMDYWIWESINVVNPRVLLLEFMPQLGASEALTVPYSSEFLPEWVPLFERDESTGEELAPETADDLSYFGRWTMYGGASLAALAKLSEKKGYRLVGANSIGFNAFFIRNDIAQDLFPAVSLESCFNENSSDRLARANEKVRDRGWVEV